MPAAGIPLLKGGQGFSPMPIRIVAVLIALAGGFPLSIKPAP